MMARADFEVVDSKPIGRGFSGTVFLARHLGDGRTVALKLVLKNEEGGAERIAAERHGAILQQRFAERHGMVPEVYDFGADADDFYIAMEFVDGPSLEMLLRGGPLAANAAAGHALWLCDFLDKAHGFSSTVEGKPYRLLHNDLKPAHLMISATGDRKVLDFGISKALEEARDLGTDVGRTIAYAAPERLLSGRVNVQADFWSVGVMVYEMVSGHRPYPALEGRRNRSQLEHAITTNAPRAPLPPHCPRHLAAIINRLLAFQPEHRYQTPSEIREDLERFLRDEAPAAAAFFDTPATTPVSRPAPSAVVAIAAPLTVPATDPVPRAPAAAVTVVSPPAAPVAQKPAVRRSSLPRIVSTFVSMAFIALFTMEGVTWLVAERFRDGIATIDERNVTARRDAYAAVDRWSVLDLGLRARVNGPLAAALRGVGDRVIADYRNETPRMGPSEWRQAQAAFTWAHELRPGDQQLRARQLIADAHVKRLEAQATKTTSAATLAYQAALARFRDAAAADETAFDPYLGMAVIQVYGLSDVEAASASIDEAHTLGYTPTRRETALLGDGYLRRGVSSRGRAQILTGEQRRKELVKAKADFERCVALFEPIVEFARAADHIEVCKAQLQRVDRQLESGEW